MIAACRQLVRWLILLPVWVGWHWQIIRNYIPANTGIIQPTSIIRWVSYIHSSLKKIMATQVPGCLAAVQFGKCRM